MNAARNFEMLERTRKDIPLSLRQKRMNELAFTGQLERLQRTCEHFPQLDFMQAAEKAAYGNRYHSLIYLLIAKGIGPATPDSRYETWRHDYIVEVCAGY